MLGPRTGCTLTAALLASGLAGCEPPSGDGALALDEPDAGASTDAFASADSGDLVGSCRVRTQRVGFDRPSEINRAGRTGVEVHNLRDDTSCRVFAVDLDGDPEALEVWSLAEPPDDPDAGPYAEYPVDVPPGAALAVDVRATWPEGAYGERRAELWIRLDAPDGPVKIVPLVAHRPWPPRTPAVAPELVDFGPVLVGCGPRRRDLTVFNPHDRPLTLVDLEVDGAGFVPLGTPPLPWTLAPGEGRTMALGFVASRVGPASGTFWGSAGRDADFAVPLTGEGTTPGHQVDRWVQIARPQVDFLFLVDDAPTMADFATSLRSNLQDFATFAHAQALDARIAITTPSAEGAFRPVDGAPEARVMSTETAGRRLADLLPERFEGPSDRRHLERVVRALRGDGPAASNPPLLRPDAKLSVTVVSDRDDGSVAGVDFFDTFLRNLKGFRDTQRFAFNAISGGEIGCQRRFGAAQVALAAPRLVELADRTGGVTAEICTSDWSRTLEDLSRSALGFWSRFFLTALPVVETIEVYVDGELISSTEPSGRVNWTWDAANNAVNFTPLAVPAPKSRVRIEYQPRCDAFR